MSGKGTFHQSRQISQNWQDFQLKPQSISLSVTLLGGSCLLTIQTSNLFRRSTVLSGQKRDETISTFKLPVCRLWLWLSNLNYYTLICHEDIAVFFCVFPAVLIYDFHIFVTSSSSFRWFNTNQFSDLLPVMLVSSIGRALHRYCRGQRFESHASLNFFRLSFRNCKSCVYNCDDLSYNSSPRSSHICFFIYS